MPDIWAQAAILVKVLLYVGALGATGLVMIRLIFAAQTAPAEALLRRQIRSLGAVALIAAGLGFSLQGAALTGGLDGMTDPEMLGLLWQTPVGDVLLYRLIGASLLVVGPAFLRVGEWGALAGGCLLLWSFAQVGHVPNLAQTGVQALLFLHLLGVAFWIGVLSPLHWLCQRRDHLQAAAQLGHRFGQVAQYGVPALVGAGAVLGALLLGSVSALLGTSYGLAFVTKIALVGAILALAAANKLRFVPAMAAGDSAAARHLAISLRVEGAAFLAVLSATAALTSLFSVPG